LLCPHKSSDEAGCFPVAVSLTLKTVKLWLGLNQNTEHQHGVLYFNTKAEAD